MTPGGGRGWVLGWNFGEGEPVEGSGLHWGPSTPPRWLKGLFRAKWEREASFFLKVVDASRVFSPFWSDVIRAAGHKGNVFRYSQMKSGVICLFFFF